MSPKCEEFIDLMVAAAERVNDERGTDVNEVVLFCPQYVMAEMLEVDPSTIRRWFYRYPALKQRVNMAYHCAVVEGGRRMKDGCLWVVAIEPVDRKLRIPAEAFAEQVRDFEGDIVRGRTLHGPLPKTAGTMTETLLLWTFQGFPPPTNSGPGSVPEAVFSAVQDVRNVASSGYYLAYLLGDANPRFWMKQLWRAARGELGPLGLVGVIERTLTDVREGFARSAPRLATARLSHNGGHR